MKFCPNCGSPLGDGVKFCTECGYKIAAAPVQEPAPAPVYTPEPKPEPAYQPEPQSEAPKSAAKKESREDPSDPDSGFNYYIILRPWGMDWEDVRIADNSDNLYTDMMPLAYDDWYLPNIFMLLVLFYLLCGCCFFIIILAK